jgi:hypothetical protein
VREPRADLFDHQRIDRSKTEADEEGPEDRSEQVVGEGQDDASEHARNHRVEKKLAVMHAWQDRLRDHTAQHQRNPIGRQEEQGSTGAHPETQNEKQREPPGDCPLITEMEEQQ